MQRLVGELVLDLTSSLLIRLDAGGHPVDRVGELADLVGTAVAHPSRPVTVAEGAGRRRQRLDSPDETTHEPPRHRSGEEQREQHGPDGEPPQRTQTVEHLGLATGDGHRSPEALHRRRADDGVGRHRLATRHRAVEHELDGHGGLEEVVGGTETMGELDGLGVEQRGPRTGAITDGGDGRCRRPRRRAVDDRLLGVQHGQALCLTPPGHRGVERFGQCVGLDIQATLDHRQDQLTPLGDGPDLVVGDAQSALDLLGAEFGLGLDLRLCAVEERVPGHEVRRHAEHGDRGDEEQESDDDPRPEPPSPWPLSALLHVRGVPARVSRVDVRPAPLPDEEVFELYGPSSRRRHQR